MKQTFMYLLAVLLLTCCKTKVVTVPEYHTDTLRQTIVLRDSVYLHDSTYVKDKGDTVWVERWHTRCEKHMAHDTLYIHKTDSIPYPVEVVKEVEKPLTRWQQLRIDLGSWAIVVFLIAFMLFVVRYIKR